MSGKIRVPQLANAKYQHKIKRLRTGNLIERQFIIVTRAIRA